jgi:hypothetical protein
VGEKGAGVKMAGKMVVVREEVLGCGRIEVEGGERWRAVKLEEEDKTIV